jgi:adenosylcobinamide-phosphate synthase
MILEILLLAVALDLIFGEPPARIHPVVFIGMLISALQRRVQPNRSNGLIIALLVVLSTVVAGHLLLKVAGSIEIFGVSIGLIFSAYLLKSTIAIRALLGTSAHIGHAIDRDIDEAREMLPALVSRDPIDLSKTQAVSSVIESLSENYVDTILSPLFYFLLLSPVGLGVEAALAYKALNTLDSMLGYKTEALVEVGYVSAKMDDIANWIPSRVSIVIMAIAFPWQALAILKTALQYHNTPSSPNSGWPIAGAAGALGIKLEKPGSYTIMDNGRDPITADIKRALIFIGLSIFVLLIAIALIIIEMQNSLNI